MARGIFWNLIQIVLFFCISYWFFSEVGIKSKLQEGQGGLTSGSAISDLISYPFLCSLSSAQAACSHLGPHLLMVFLFACSLVPEESAGVTNLALHINPTWFPPRARVPLWHFCTSLLLVPAPSMGSSWYLSLLCAGRCPSVQNGAPHCRNMDFMGVWWISVWHVKMFKEEFCFSWTPVNEKKLCICRIIYWHFLKYACISAIFAFVQLISLGS